MLVAALFALAMGAAKAVVWDSIITPPITDFEVGEPYEMVDGVWVPVENPLTSAIVFRFGSQQVKNCNGETVNQDGKAVICAPVIDIEASVAQYVEIVLNRDHLTWYIFKPYLLDASDPNDILELDRDFVVDSIHLGVKSNGAVTIISDPIRNLVGLKPDPDTDSGFKEIPLLINLRPMDPDVTLPPSPRDPGWVGQGGTISIGVPEDLNHDLHFWEIWNWIHTKKCTSACTYESKLQLCVVYEEQKPWIIELIQQGYLPVIKPTTPN